VNQRTVFAFIGADSQGPPQESAMSEIEKKPDPRGPGQPAPQDPERPAAKVFGVDVQPLRELVWKVVPLAHEVRRRLQDRIAGR
jgi:hypothetical protein